VDRIKIKCTSSPPLQSRTCGQPVVYQPLGAPNQYRAPNLRSSWPCNNTRLSSPKNMRTSRWIMNSFTNWSWTWHHRVVIHVCLLFGLITTSLLLQLRHYVNLIFVFETHSICNEYYLTLFLLFLMFNKNFICIIVFFSINLYNFILFILNKFF
jgi:hypothetical protein